MNDKELADALVADGIGDESTPCAGVIDGFYFIDNDDEDPWMKPEQFVRDWRVAGACMERVRDGAWVNEVGKRIGSVNGYMGTDNESLPRAICEAYVKGKT